MITYGSPRKPHTHTHTRAQGGKQNLTLQAGRTLWVWMERVTPQTSRATSLSTPVSLTHAELEGRDPGPYPGKVGHTRQHCSPLLFLLLSLFPVSPCSRTLPTHSRPIYLWVSWRKSMVTGKLFLEYLELDSTLS